MTFYQKHLLPKCLDRVMRRKDLEHYRRDVVAGLTGTGLEIGFGSGLNLPYYQNVTTLYALDPSRELYDMARENIAAAAFPVEQLQASAERIPLPDASLDFVVSTWTLCSIPHPVVALHEVLRVLKPGGRFSFVEHGKSPKRFSSQLQDLLTPISKRIAGGCHMNRDIETLIRSAGFEILNLEKSSPRGKPLGFMYKGIAVAKT